MDKIRTFNKKFVDSYGRERIFYGMNVCDKEEWSREKKTHCFGKDLSWIDEFKKTGFNIIRLGTTWGAIEPEPGKYNDELIANIKTILEKCKENGIYVYLDMHQDLFSPVCYGDGAPEWATLTDDIEAKKQKFVWAEGYFWGKSCHRAFDNFWRNKKVDGKGIQDYFTDMWCYLLKGLSECGSLIGFDFFNEPFPGKTGGLAFAKIIAGLALASVTDSRVNLLKIFDDTSDKDFIAKVLDRYSGDVLLKITSSASKIISRFDSKYYTPFLNRLTSAIRKIKDDGIVFIEGCYYSNLGILSGSFPITIDGKREKNQCYSPHGYDIMVDTDLYKYASDSRVKAIFEQHRRTQNRLNVPVLVGEWGGGSTGTEWLEHIKFLLKIFDKYKWSSTYWTFDHSVFEHELINVLKRPYPKAVTGNIEYYSYNEKQNSFTLEYTQGRKYTAPTVIFCHKKVDGIITDGEYSYSAISDTAGELSVNTKPGKHIIKIFFED